MPTLPPSFARRKKERSARAGQKTSRLFCRTCTCPHLAHLQHRRSWIMSGAPAAALQTFLFLAAGASMDAARIFVVRSHVIVAKRFALPRSAPGLGCMVVRRFCDIVAFVEFSVHSGPHRLTKSIPWINNRVGHRRGCRGSLRRNFSTSAHQRIYCGRTCWCRYVPDMSRFQHMLLLPFLQIVSLVR